MDDVTLKGMLGGEPEWFAEIETRAGAAAGRPLAVAGYRAAVYELQELASRFQDIDNDRALSAEGKAQKKSRAARDAAARLAKVAEHRDKLAAELETARGALVSKEASESIMAAIWQRLPNDPQAVRETYGEAVAAKDWTTCAAIEALPVAFDNRLDADTLNALKRQRLAAENPDALAALEQAEENLRIVEGALHSTTMHVHKVGRDLPEPDDGGAPEYSDDGLRKLSPSQLAEAS